MALPSVVPANFLAPIVINCGNTALPIVGNNPANADNKNDIINVLIL